MPAFGDHPVTVFLAWVSAGACGLGVAVEIMRTYWQIHALCSTNCSWCMHNLDVNTSDNFYTGTDIPYQPGAYITAPLYHIVAAFILFLLFLSELPDTPFFTSKLGEWCIIFAPDQSPWLTGLLEIFIGLGILAIPAALYGNYSEIWLRYITGWILFGIGALIFLSGLAKGATIREWRGQKPKAEDAGDPKGDAKAKWAQFKGQFNALVMTNAFGAVMTQFNELDGAMGKL